MKTTSETPLIVSMANYFLENNSTIRATAKVFHRPKSTVHHNLSKKLKQINLPLFLKVQKLLKNNFNNKHIYGGEATRKKYEKLKLETNLNDNIELLI